MDDNGHFRSLRRLLLLWVALVAIWGFMGARGGGNAFAGSTSATLYQRPIVQVLPTISGRGILFLGLMGVYGALLWIGLSGKMPRRLFWLYLLAQGSLVLGASLVFKQISIALNLYLVLTLMVIGLIRQIHITLVIIAGYLLLVISYIVFTRSPWNYWQFAQLDLSGGVQWLARNISDCMALIFLMIGYLMLSAQWIRTHTWLVAAHVQLEISTRRIEELTTITDRQHRVEKLQETLAQGLAGIIMQMQVARSHLMLQHYARTQQIMQRTMTSARELLTEAQNTIDNFLSPEIFAEAVRKKIQHFVDTTGTFCADSGFDLLATLPASFREHVLRMLHEVLGNIARHAQARHVWIDVEEHEHMFTIIVCDDGIGFDPATVKALNGSYSLTDLSERARLLGGNLVVSSAPGQGTTVQFDIPHTP